MNKKILTQNQTAAILRFIGVSIENGPVTEHASETKYWYLNGKFHRENGPAIEYANGDKHWYLDGEQLTESEFNIRMKELA